MLSWFRRFFRGQKPASSRVRRQPRLECLEDRTVPVASVRTLASGVTQGQLVQSLVRSGISVSNVRYVGDNQAAGLFQGGSGSIGIPSGVVLSTGRAAQVAGANRNSGMSTNWNREGNPQLTAIAGRPTHDAALLEFDFVPRNGSLALSYVFGSEEYPEFVNSGFNDVFAIFIDGRRANFIPGGNTPISVNSVNAGANARFFVRNTPAQRNVELDGFTTVITNLIAVTPGVKHRIRFAIADAQDYAYDSAVFLQSIGSPSVTTYNPMRFIYDPFTRTYEGSLKVVNNQATPLPGPLFISFKLPAGVSLANPQGRTPSGVPFVTLPGGLPPGQLTRLTVKLHNPFRVPMGTFFLNNSNVQLSNILL